MDGGEEPHSQNRNRSPRTQEAQVLVLALPQTLCGPPVLWSSPPATVRTYRTPVNVTWVSPHEGVDSDDEFINILQVLR